MVEKSQSAELGEHNPGFLFAMGELSGQVRSLTQEIAQMRLDRAAERKELLVVISKHDDRIDVLEAWRWRVLGGAGVVSFVVVQITNYIVGKL